ncbi:MAG: DegT/DnrJ/EryC1/StrS family aminotransferase [Alcanivoracaceae bacterium]|nr:DegT/DnrJ/EryC1/StrS family aminotransferase [Alcanivoracaceae bacterium]
MSKVPPIMVTRPSLPPLEELLPYLEGIWQRGVLTNSGPLHQQLEKALADYLGVPFVSLFNNGTIALLTALKALDLKGEVITTPYSFVATAHAVVWNGLTPVFADIDADNLNLSPAAIEAAITEQTCAILPVHCYGSPCDSAAIADIARRHNLKVVYDAAHAFAVEDAGGSILRHGDLAVLSLHATKVFNTFEGGAIISHSESMKQRVDALRNFGFADEVSLMGIGGNGKMNEFNAAVGLAQLAHIDEALARRAEVAERYRAGLAGVAGIRLPSGQALRHNHSYFPILLDANFPLGRDQLHEQMKQAGIFARRYFYPLICDFTPYKNARGTDAVSQARLAADQVLCLPIYPGLSDAEISRVLDCITGAGR